MKSALFIPLALLFLVRTTALPAEEPAKPVLKIIPGQVIVPLDAMRRIGGELLTLDFKTRTGTFRKENTDEVMSFTILPYAELKHRGTFGDLQDFRIGQRCIFRLHENNAGAWDWLTYIVDEVSMMVGHKEYFQVDGIEPDKGRLVCTQRNFEADNFIRTKGLQLETDPATLYWKDGQPAKFSDIKVGDKLRAETHGLCKGLTRLCWEIFIDDASTLKAINEQKAAESKRLKEEGAPSYVDKLEGNTLELTFFQESGEVSNALKPGQKIRVAAAGVDRKPTITPVAGTVAETKAVSNLRKVTVTLDAASTAFPGGGVARLWAAQN